MHLFCPVQKWRDPPHSTELEVNLRFILPGFYSSESIPLAPTGVCIAVRGSPARLCRVSQAAVAGAQQPGRSGSLQARSLPVPPLHPPSSIFILRTPSFQTGGALTRTPPHWSAHRNSPAPPGGLKPDTVRGGCSVGAGLCGHNCAEPPAPGLQLPAALGPVPSAN